MTSSWQVEVSRSTADWASSGSCMRREPFNRGWHMFGLGNLGWYLGFFLPGVSADL